MNPDHGARVAELRELWRQSAVRYRTPIDLLPKQITGFDMVTFSADGKKMLCRCGREVTWTQGRSITMPYDDGKGAVEVRLEVCDECADSTPCTFERDGWHRVVIAFNEPAFDPSKVHVGPAAPHVKIGYCARCRLPMFLSGRRWKELTWAVVARSWAAHREV